MYFLIESIVFINFIQIILFHNFILSEHVQNINSYSITIFVSNTSTEKHIFSKPVLIDHFPKKIFSFEKSLLHETSASFSSANQNIFQVSIVIFHTNDLNEIKDFIDYLGRFLSPRTRPKCLIVLYHTQSDFSDISEILKYAWRKSFLDFSLIELNRSSNSVIYNYNPFFEQVNKSNFTQNVQIFPDKLKNINGYPIHIQEFDVPKSAIKHVRLPTGKIKFLFTNENYLNLTLKFMNLTIARKYLKFQLKLKSDFLSIWDSDMLGILFYSATPSDRFIIPSGQPGVKIVAVVPVITTSQVNVSLIFFFTAIIFCGFLVGTITLIKHFRFSILTDLKNFDLVGIFLIQPIHRKPRKTIDRIIFMMISIAFVKILTNYYTKIINVKFQTKEILFKNYKDLEHLQPVSDMPYIKELEIQNPDLKAWINKTIQNDIIGDCLTMLEKSKNISCLMDEVTAEWYLDQIDETFGYRAMKVAEIPLINFGEGYYWFKSASPYAFKFDKINRVIKEGGLTQIPFLVQKDRHVYEIQESGKTKFNEINLQQLMLVLYVGLTIASVTFIIEIILFVYKKGALLFHE